MANTLRPQVGGLGLGAATPAQTPLSPQKPKPEPFTPTISRPRVGGVPQVDQAQPAPVRRRYTPPRPILHGNLPPGGVPTPPAPRPKANVTTSGLRGVWDIPSKAADVINKPFDYVASKVPKGALSRAGESIFGSYGGSGIAGAFNKAYYLTADAAAVRQSLGEVISPDKTAEILYNANPGNYQNIEEAKNEVRNFNSGEFLGIIGENIAQGAVTNLISRVIGGIALRAAGAAATIGVIAAAPVELSAGAAVAVTIATYFAISAIYEQVSKLTSPQMQDQAMLAKTAPDEYARMIAGNAPQDATDPSAQYQQMSEGGIGGQLVGSFADAMISNIKDATSREPGQRSWEEVKAVRDERGTYKFAATVSDYNADGFPAKLPLYATFGKRNAEVDELLRAGYFLTARGENGMGGFEPYTDANGRRIFDIDYASFVKWLEDTDWLANDNPGIAQRVFKLPKISSNVILAQKTAPITNEEWRLALKFWYDKGANEQQKLLLTPRE